MSEGFPTRHRRDKGALQTSGDFDSRNYSQLTTAVISSVSDKYINVIIKATEFQDEEISKGDIDAGFPIPVQVPISCRDNLDSFYSVGQEVLIDRLKIPAIAEAEEEEDYNIQLNYHVVGGSGLEYPQEDTDPLMMLQRQSTDSHGEAIDEDGEYCDEAIDPVWATPRFVG
jgi:hypothetical protein